MESLRARLQTRAVRAERVACGKAWIQTVEAPVWVLLRRGASLGPHRHPSQTRSPGAPYAVRLGDPVNVLQHFFHVRNRLEEGITASSQADLYGVLRFADVLRDRSDRLAVAVAKLEDLPMGGRA